MTEEQEWAEGLENGITREFVIDGTLLCEGIYKDGEFRILDDETLEIFQITYRNGKVVK